MRFELNEFNLVGLSSCTRLKSNLNEGALMRYEESRIFFEKANNTSVSLQVCVIIFQQQKKKKADECTLLSARVSVSISFPRTHTYLSNKFSHLACDGFARALLSIFRYNRARTQTNIRTSARLHFMFTARLNAKSIRGGIRPQIIIYSTIYTGCATTQSISTLRQNTHFF
jgi:hypothetical protein